MIDGMGGFRGSLAGLARAMVRNHRRNLGEDKGSPGYIMARAKSQKQLERRQGYKKHGFREIQHSASVLSLKLVA